SSGEYHPGPTADSHLSGSRYRPGFGWHWPRPTRQPAHSPGLRPGHGRRTRISPVVWKPFPRMKKNAHTNTQAPHRARKRFGQNFLIDHGVIREIVRAIHPKPGDQLVEIGPGKGAITQLLADSGAQLSVIELDRDLVPWLRVRFEKYPGFRLYQADALAFDFTQLMVDGQPLRIVGNLPYNISTPLIFHLLSYAERVSDMHFMLQKEVVKRMAAQ